MSVIQVSCVDQVLSFENMPVITAGNKNVDQVEFSFCSLWDGFIKVAVFFQQREALSYSMIGADGVCSIPNSILTLTGDIYISVVGVNSDNQTRTTNILSYEIGDGIVNAVSPEDFPGTEEEATEFYDNILAMCVEMQEMYTDVLNNLAYVHVKDGNEFEYYESKIEAKIRAYTMSLEQILEKFSELSNSIASVNNDLTNSIATTNSTITAMNGTYDTAISDLSATFNEQLDNLNSSLNVQINSVSTSIYSRIDALEESLNAEIADIYARLDALS